MSEQPVGERIAQLRAARGLTGEQLGHALGLTKSQVSKIENGTRKLDVSEVALVADALGVTLGEVLGVERRGGLALAARVMTAAGQEETAPARRRVRQVLEAEAALTDAIGLLPARPSDAGTAVLDRVRTERLASPITAASGTRLAEVVREELGIGRAPISDLPALIERHFGVGVVIWPVGKAVSGLCAHGTDVALILMSSSFPGGHQRFTAAHELAHHLLGDPREVIIESDFAVSTLPERRANAFAAAFLMPADGLREVVRGRPVDDVVLAELMREFAVSYTALLHRLADASVGLLSYASRDKLLQRSPTAVLRVAGDPAPAELTRPDEARRVPPRLLAAAQRGYENGRVGLGILAALLDEDADSLYTRLAKDGVTPPAVDDDMADL